jgi:transcriptional regulator with XRE-family HTH domain
LGEARVQLGARVREIRRGQQKTQGDVAERAGLSYKFIGEVERGMANPSIDTIEKLARGLGVSVSQLFDAPIGVRYPSHEREIPLVREITASLESLLARVKRASRPQTRRPAAKKR